MRTTKRLRILAILSISALAVLTAHTVSVGLPSESALADFPACSDGKDNDLDGFADYPQDEDCLTLHDESEGPTHNGLFLSLSDGLEEVRTGDSITYTVGLRSDRKEPKEVEVRLFIPHQTNLLEISNGGRQEGEYIVWRNITVQPRATRNLYAGVQVNPNATVGQLIVAEVTSDGTKNVDTTRVTDSGMNLPLRLIVNDGKEFAKHDEELHYKITVRNDFGADQNYNLRVQIPKQIDFIASEGNFVHQNGVVSWNNQALKAQESRDYVVIARVKRSAEEFELIRLFASTEDASAADLTTIRDGLGASAFSLSLNDGQTSAMPGDELMYEIVLRNNENSLATEVDVNNQLPTYTEFVSATEGGHWTGTNVRWTGLTVSPHGERVLRVTARVRSDAPMGAALKSTVLAQGNQAVDITDVAEQVVKVTQTQVPSSVMLRKIADKSEVRPGDTVGYTILVKNTTGRTLHNVMVEDRMDNRYMRVLGGTDGQLTGDRMQWMIPVLEAGEEWRTHYTAAVSPSTPHGIEIANIVSVTGDGLDFVSLTEKVLTMQTNVVGELPPTGAAFDLFILAIIALVAGAQVTAQRLRLQSIIG